MYDELKQATPQEILEAAVAFWKPNNPEAEKWLRLGFALAQPDGWENVAPAWLRELRHVQERDERKGAER